METEMSPSEVTQAWNKANPEKYKANCENAKKRTYKRQKEAIQDLKKSEFKSPSEAIRAFCRFRCEKAEGRYRGSAWQTFMTPPYRESKRPLYLKAPVACGDGECPLYAFRNCDPRAVKKGMKQRNIVGNRVS